MAVRPVHVLFISLLLYELASGQYCRNEDNSSIQFCQSGTISGSKVYINGSSVKTKEELKDRGCVCYLEQVGTMAIIVDAKESCLYCGLRVSVGDFILQSIFYNSQGHGWGWIILNATKFTLILSLDGSTGRLNTAFCITIQLKQPDITSVLTLTCEDDVTRSSSSSSTNPYTVPDTTKSRSPTSAETVISLSKTETTSSAVVSAGNTNVTHGPNTNNIIILTTISTANDPGEPKVHTRNEEIVVGAAVGGSCGGVVLVIVINVIIFICYKRRIKNKYMQRQSTAPPRLYTELEFSSRDGQNDNHLYNSIETQHTYVNGVQFD